MKVVSEARFCRENKERKAADADLQAQIDGGGGGGATNLGYTPAPTNGIVTSSTGISAILSLASGTNAGLLSPAGFTTLSGLSSAYQPLDSDLTAIAALTTAAYGRSILTTATAPSAATLLGLGTGDTPAFAGVQLGTSGYLVGGTNTVSQRNGTNAQMFQVSNTYTDASNYERALFGWVSNVLQIGTAKLGTGITRNIQIVGGTVGIGVTPSTRTLDVPAGATYGYNGQIAIQADTALSNWFFGSAGNFTMTGGNNSAMGNQALAANTTGANNSVMGYRALYSNTTGANNSAMGYLALNFNTIGANNSAMGYQALRLNTTGANNSGIGSQALSSNTTGANNSAMGYLALYDLQPTSLAISAFADYSATVAGTVRATSTAHGRTTGDSLIISGTQPSTNAYDGTYTVTVIDANSFYFTKAWVATGTAWWTLAGQTGSNNTAFGYNAGRGITYGSGNTILGASVTGLAPGLTNNVILASGAGVTRAQFDGTNWKFHYPIIHSPSASITPTNNGELVFERTSNTLVTIKLKGTDGTVRSGTVTLS